MPSCRLSIATGSARGTGRALGSTPDHGQGWPSCTASPACPPSPSPGFRLWSWAQSLACSSIAAQTCWGWRQLLPTLSSHLSKNVLHLSLLVTEALYLLGDPGVLLQLLQSCPLTVEVGAAEEEKNPQNVTRGLWARCHPPGRPAGTSQPPREHLFEIPDTRKP